MWATLYIRSCLSCFSKSVPPCRRRRSLRNGPALTDVGLRSLIWNSRRSRYRVRGPTARALR